MGLRRSPRSPSSFVGDLGDLDLKLGSDMDTNRRLVRLTKVKEETIKWIWRGVLCEGMITELSGDPGQRKSRVTYDLVARITTGKPMPNCADGIPIAGAVIIQGEDSVSKTVRKSLKSCGADIGRVFVYDPRLFKDEPFLLPDDLGLVEEAVDSVNAKLVLIDPAANFVNCNANSEQSVRKALKALGDFAARKKISILLVRHLNKGGGSNILYHASGSIAWTAAARVAFRAISDPTCNDPYRHLLMPIKSNVTAASTMAYRTVLSADGQITVEWLGPSSLTSRDMANSDNESKLFEAMEVLFLILRYGPVESQKVYKKSRESGIADRTLQRAKLVLRVKSERKIWYKRSWNWMWRLPNEVDPKNWTVE